MSEDEQGLVLDFDLGDERELSVTTEGDFSAPPPELGLKISSPSRHAGTELEGLDLSNDENAATKWCLGHGNRFPIVWQADVVGKRPAVTSYALTSGNDMPDRDPGAWRFLGSQAGASWTLLDERRDEPAWDKRNARRVFAVSNSTAYAHYRFEFLRVHDNASMFQISEIALLPAPVTGGAVTVAVPAATPESGVRVVKLEPKR